jgi:hypothetical protein
MVYYNTLGGTVCMPDDQTFYCRLSRFSGEVSMIVGLLLIPILFYLLFKKK